MQKESNIKLHQTSPTSFKTSNAAEATVWGPLLLIDAESPWHRRSIKRNWVNQHTNSSKFLINVMPWTIAHYIIIFIIFVKGDWKKILRIMKWSNLWSHILSPIQPLTLDLHKILTELPDHFTNSPPTEIDQRRKDTPKFDI